MTVAVNTFQNMEVISPPANNEFHYLVAEVKKTSLNVNPENLGCSSLPAEALLLKSSQKVLSTKLKNRNNTSITEIPEEEIQGNPIGMLQELCMMRRWMPPEYSTEQEEGLPHERLFTILCTVGNLKEYGIGRSKKLAKRQSAHKMVQKILMIPAEDEKTLRNLEDDDEIVDRFVSQKNGRAVATNAGISRRISLFHRNLKCLSGTKITKLKSSKNLDNELLQKIDPIKWLKEIALENKLEVTYVNIEEISKNGTFQSLVQLSTVPVAVCHGSAPTIEEARREATINALKYIHLLSE